MKTSLFAALVLGVVAGVVRADVTETSAEPYDMTMLEVTGSAEAGKVTLTAAGKSASVTLAAAGNYTLAVEGLTPGSVCTYTVSQGTSRSAVRW